MADPPCDWDALADPRDPLGDRGCRETTEGRGRAPLGLPGDLSPEKPLKSVVVVFLPLPPPLVALPAPCPELEVLAAWPLLYEDRPPRVDEALGRWLLLGPLLSEAAPEDG